LSNGIFISGSSDKKIRIWRPHETKPLGEIEEESEILEFIKL